MGRRESLWGSGMVVAAGTRMKNDLTHSSLNTENMTLFTDGRDAGDDDGEGGNMKAEGRRTMIMMPL